MRALQPTALSNSIKWSLLDRGGELHWHINDCGPDGSTLLLRAAEAAQDQGSDRNLEVFRLLLDRGGRVRPFPLDRDGASLAMCRALAAAGGKLDEADFRRILQEALKKDFVGAMKGFAAAACSVARWGQHGLPLLRQLLGCLKTYGSPIHCAARFGHEETLRYLLELPVQEAASVEAAPNAGPNASWPPIFDAATNGHAACCSLLLERGGADFKARYSKNELWDDRNPRWTLLEAAARGGHVECVELFVGAGADLAAEGPALVAAAAEGGHAEMIRFLASRGVPVDADPSDAGRNPPIVLAAQRLRASCIRVLAELGAAVAAPATDGSLVLHEVFVPVGLAFGQGAEDQSRADFAGEQGARHMQACYACLREEAIRACLGVGADPRARDRKGRSPLHRALALGRHLSASCLQLLLEAGAEVDAEALDGATPLMTALKPGAAAPSSDAIALLLDRGADVSRLAVQGGLACLSPDLALLRRFLAAGLRAGLDGALVRALGEGFADVAEIAGELLAAGADPARPPALYHAMTLAEEPALRGFAADFLRRALEAGADLNYNSLELDLPREVGRPIAGAVQAGSPDLVRALVAGGASARPERGRLPLLWLALDRPAQDFELSVELARILVPAGASYTDVGPRTETVLGRVMQAGPSYALRPAIVRFVLEEDARAAEAPDAPRPIIARNPDGTLSGIAASYVLTCFKSELNADDWRLALDLLLRCEGRLHALDFVRPQMNLRSRAPGSDEVLRAVLRLAVLEGRVDPDPPPAAFEKREPFAPEDGPGGESALACACRHGLRLTALRLARAAPEADLDGRDAEGETALSRAVASGPALLAVCELLLKRGADVGAVVGKAGKQRPVLDCTRDAEFRARLKRLAAVRDVFISYGHHPPEVARFTVQLRDQLQAAGVSLDESKPSGIEAGTEWREQIGAGIKAASAVVFVASKHSCNSDWCMLELSRARDLGRPLFAVWRERCPVDDRCATLLLGCPAADFTTDEALGSGLAPFVASLRSALDVPSPSSAPPAALPRCDLAAPEPYCLLCCRREDASEAAKVASALSFRGRRCWVDCDREGDAMAAEEAEAERALAGCALFVPLLSRDALRGGYLAERTERARALGRAVRPLLLLPLVVPAALEYSLAAQPLLALFDNDEPRAVFAIADEAGLGEEGHGAPAAVVGAGGATAAPAAPAAGGQQMPHPSRRTTRPLA
eukprot:tig00021489_g21702.t1